MSIVQQGSILLSVRKIEVGFQKMSTLIGETGQEDGITPVIINSAYLYQKDASCYWFGVTGASGLVQNHSFSKASEAHKAGSAAVGVE